MEKAVYFVVTGCVKEDQTSIPTFVQSQIDSMRKIGWKVYIGIVDNRTSIRSILRSIKRIRREICCFRPLIVHSQYGSITAAIAQCARNSVPLIVSFCGDDLLGTPIPGLQHRIREFLARIVGLRAADNAAKIIVKSRNLFQSLPSRLQTKAVILPNGIDTDQFQPLSREECMSKFNLNNGCHSVLFNVGSGRNQYVKNLPLAQDIIENLKKLSVNAQLKIISNTNKDDVCLMLNAADCLLVTSYHEGSPNIVKEAMACNLPVVSVPCGDVAERLRNVSPGSVYPYDCLELAKGIQLVLQEKGRSNGRNELFKQGLSADAIAKRLDVIYRNVIEKTIVTI